MPEKDPYLSDIAIDTDDLCQHVLSLLSGHLLHHEYTGTLAEISNALRWEALVRSASREGVLGLLHRAAAQLAVSPPEPTFRSLVFGSLAIERRNRMLIERTTSLLRKAQERQLLLIPIKGAALLMRGLYTDWSSRAMGDVDLLVPHQQYDAVAALLEDEGYVAETRSPHARRYEHHVRYFRVLDGKAHKLELHWLPFYTLYRRASGVEDALFSRTISSLYQGETFRSLDWIDTLLMLLTHLAHHRFRGELKWIIDIQMLSEKVKASPRAWKMFEERAAAIGARDACCFGLWFVNALWQQHRQDGQQHHWQPMFGQPRLAILRLLHQPDTFWAKKEQSWRPARALTDFALIDSPKDGFKYLLNKIPEIVARELKEPLRQRCRVDRTSQVS